MPIDDDDDDEDGTWIEGMERNIKAANLKEVERVIEDTVSRMSAPGLTDEEYLELIHDFDHEHVLSNKVDMDFVRRLQPRDRVAFFRYYMLLMFSRMFEKEGMPEVISAMARAGILQMVDDDTNKPWRGRFGKVPRFEPDLLGMVQSALRAKASPSGDRLELEKDGLLATTVKQVLQASTDQSGKLQQDDIVRCTGAAIYVHTVRTPAIQQVLKEDDELADLSDEERIRKAMPDMLMLVYFLLLASGLYEQMIHAIVKNAPLLRRVGNSATFELTPSGRQVEWIRK